MFRDFCGIRVSSSLGNAHCVMYEYVFQCALPTLKNLLILPLHIGTGNMIFERKRMF
jgi:hypothetical protein